MTNLNVSALIDDLSLFKKKSDIWLSKGIITFIPQPT